MKREQQAAAGPPTLSPPLIAAVCLLFSASGFSALIYQVAWVRVLSLSFGTTIYAISTVLTVFMAGLALGSFLLGRWIDRQRRPLLVYGVLEIALAIYVTLFVLAIPWLQEMMVALLRGRELSHTLTSLTKFSIAVVLLLPPTTLMGGTLPVLAKFVTRSSATIGKWMGLIYGLNTLGAVFGSLAAAYVLILRLGVAGTMLLACAITGLVGLFSCVLSARSESGPAEGAGSVEPPSQPTIDGTGLTSSLPGSRLKALYTIAFSSGFITLAAEVLWTRLFVNFLTGNVLTFATILSAFLTGIALGSFLVSRWVDRLRSLDVAVALSILTSALLLGASVLGQSKLGWMFHNIRATETLTNLDKVNLSLAAMFVVVAIPATVFGTVLPSLFRWCSRSVTTLGHDIGVLYAWNTIGSIAGSFCSGFLMIPFLGLNTSLMLLSLIYCLLAAMVVRAPRLRLISASLALAALMLVALPSVRRPIYWFNGGFTQLRRLPPDQTLFLDEGIEGTVGVATNGEIRALTVNGVAVAEDSLHDIWDLLLKAHLPMLLHEDPKRVALVGLGAGVSLGAVASYQEPERIDTIEIAAEVVPAHRLFASVNGQPWNDTRVHLSIHDGRHFLLTTEHRYDVISVDPTDPPVVYQYTQDFMQLCYDRLDIGGIMVQWVPLFHLSPEHLRVIMRGFLNVFPESSLWYDGTSVLLMGRRERPLAVDIRQMEERLQQPGVRANLSMIGNPDVWRLLSTFVAGPNALERIVGPDVPENSDNRPYLEYAILRRPPVTREIFAANLEMFESHLEPVENLVRDPDRSAENLERLRRENLIMKGLLRSRIQAMKGDTDLSRETLIELVGEVAMGEEEFAALWPFYKD